MVVLKCCCGYKDDWLYKDDCLAQTQAGKAQISFADLWGEETVPCRVFTRYSQMADCRVSPAQACWSSLKSLAVLH